MNQMFSDLVTAVNKRSRTKSLQLWVMLHACYSSMMFSAIPGVRGQRGIQLRDLTPSLSKAKSELSNEDDDAYLCCCCDLDSGRLHSRSSVSDEIGFWSKRLNGRCDESWHRKYCPTPDFAILDVLGSGSCATNAHAPRICKEKRTTKPEPKLPTAFPTFDYPLSKNPEKWKSKCKWFGVANAAEDVCTGSFFPYMDVVMRRPKGISTLNYRQLVDKAHKKIQEPKNSHLVADFVDPLLRHKRIGALRRPAAVVGFGEVDSSFSYVGKFWCTGSLKQTCEQRDKPEKNRLREAEDSIKRAKSLYNPEILKSLQY